MDEHTYWTKTQIKTKAMHIDKHQLIGSHSWIQWQYSFTPEALSSWRSDCDWAGLGWWGSSCPARNNRACLCCHNQCWTFTKLHFACARILTYLDLVTPAGKVSERLDGHAYVCLEGQRVHGSRVDGLDGSQLLLVFLHQVCKPGGSRSDADHVHYTGNATVL